MKDLGDNVSGRMAALPTGFGKDMTKAFAHFNNAPDTKETVEWIKGVTDLMEYILPTNILKQVTDLDRATTYQAAATVQGANRRSLKGAKIIDDQAMLRIRLMMVWNLLQFTTTIQLLDPQTKQYVDTATAQFREKNLEFDTGEGIQGIDRLMIVHLLHDIINALLQSQEAQKQVDIVGLIDYWTKLFGLRIDINQFKFPQQQNPQIAQQQDQQHQQNQDKIGNITELAKAAAQLKSGQGQGGQQTGSVP